MRKVKQYVSSSMKLKMRWNMSCSVFCQDGFAVVPVHILLLFLHLKMCVEYVYLVETALCTYVFVSFARKVWHFRLRGSRDPQSRKAGRVRHERRHFLGERVVLSYIHMSWN